MTIDKRTSSLETHLGFWLRFVSNNVSARFKQLLEQHGSSVSEWVALRTLFDRPQTTHTELINALGMTKGATSKMVSRLEKKGLARRHLAEGSARDQMISLTKAGLLLVPVLAAQADENERHFFGHLSDKKRVALMDVLQDLVAHHQFKETPVE